MRVRNNIEVNIQKAYKAMDLTVSVRERLQTKKTKHWEH